MNGNGHTTKYGNFYTDHEWSEMQKNFEQEYREAVDWLDKKQAILEAAAKMLSDAGIESNAYGIASRIWDFGLDGIQFSSPEREEAVTEIAAWIDERGRELGW